MTPARLRSPTIAALALILLIVTPGVASGAARRLLGVVPDTGGPAKLVAAAARPAPAFPARAAAGVGGPVAHAAALPYRGGSVMHANRTHLVFWSPTGSGLGFPPGYYGLMEKFLGDVARDSHKPTNVYSLSGQYADAGGPAAYDSVYVGASLDTDPLPGSGCHEPLLGGPGWSVCLTDAQLQSELGAFAATQNLPHGSRDIYFIVTPDGLGSCEFTGPQDCALGGITAGSYCGYHSVTADRELLYAVIPYNAVPGHCQSANPRPNGSSADPALSTISHEHNEVVTDPFGDAWIDSSGNENGDLCIRSYGADLGGSGISAYNEVIGTGHYYLQAEYSNWNQACAARTAPDTLTFGVSARPTTGRPVSFVAHGVAANGRIVSYAWSFGAHASGRGSAPRYTFARPGRYRITVRSTDSAGLWASSAQTITVTASRPRIRRRR